MWWRPLVVYAGVLAVLLVLSWQVVQHVALRADALPPIGFPGEWFWGGWFRWDGGWYVGIADGGYGYTKGQQSSIAFFPGYPLSIRAVSHLTHNTVLAGVAITIACGAASFVAFHRWLRDRLEPRAALTALLCLALYPYAYYVYGAVYGDALFLLCALLAFLAFERDHMVLAGLAGAAATATRLVGVAVVVGLVVGVLERRRAVDPVAGRPWRPRFELGRLRPGDAGVLLSIGGLAAWSAFLWERWGDPLAFSTVQTAWGQGSGIVTWAKRDWIASVVRRPTELFTVGLVIQAALAALVLLCVPAIARRFGWRYGAYTALIVAIPAVGSQDFQGVGRYLVATFPFFGLVGAWLTERPTARRVLLPLSALGLLTFTALFANGRYLS